MGLFRLVFFGFIILGIIYFVVSIYARSIRRERLEKDWAEEHPDLNDGEERRAYIENGMEDYSRGIRPKLLLLIFVVPPVLVVLALVITNSN